MSTIIAGRFQQQDQVQQVIAQMLAAGFPEDRISAFYVNPPGQHDLYRLGGDRDQSPGAEQSDKGMAVGGMVGAAVGVAAAPVLGPVGTVTGALVGTHIGSLVGTLNNMQDDGQAAEEKIVPIRKSGLLVAISATDAASESRAIDVLRASHADEIERTEGTIIDGDWQDFDPLEPPQLLAKS